jgi:NAD+ synthase
MTPKQQIEHITQWIGVYARSNRISSLVVGVSGGIDSAVVSTLCARTRIPTQAVVMPIHQAPELHSRSLAHCEWLLKRFDNVSTSNVDLTPVFDAMRVLEPGKYQSGHDVTQEDLAWANTRSRLRMATLYQIAQCHHGIVVGTGNRVEDFGVGFFTKYGDGGVDISPIGDCVKTEVWDMGRELGILSEIIEAAPTDGLWSDGRTDEDQLGMTYPELEQAMQLDRNGTPAADERQQINLERYRVIRRRNLHKMTAIPVCAIAK